MQKYIYCVTNQINGLKYIGQTKNPKRRWYSLCCNNDNQKITKAIQKHGKENFKMEILETCNIEKIDEREKYWIDKLNTYRGEGYNEHCGGRTLGEGKEHPRTGKETPEKVKEKMRKSLKENGTWQKRQGENHPFYGKKHTKKELAKMKKSFRENSPFDKKEAIKIIKKYHENNLTRKDIAKKYNVHPNTIGEILNCRHWTTKDLRKAN